MYKKIVEEYISKLNFNEITEKVTMLDNGDKLIMSEYNTKTVNDMVFEKHEKFVDGFYMLDGEEIVLVSKALDKIVKEYDADGDCALGMVKDSEKVVIKKGDLLILDTDEWHKPTLAIGESSKVKKAIFKIRKR